MQTFVQIGDQSWAKIDVPSIPFPPCDLGPFILEHASKRSEHHFLTLDADEEKYLLESPRYQPKCDAGNKMSAYYTFIEVIRSLRVLRIPASVRAALVRDDDRSGEDDMWRCAIEFHKPTGNHDI